MCIFVKVDSTSCIFSQSNLKESKYIQKLNVSISESLKHLLRGNN